MLKSMTGFGRCENATDEYKISVEMKAVNHRYLDLSIKMPKKFNALESKIRNELKKFIKRGKVDVFISYEDFSETDARVKYNKEIAAEYLGYKATNNTKYKNISMQILAIKVAQAEPATPQAKCLMKI